MLFSNIFDSLSNMDYDPELFGKALPCLTAIGCALPPDYSLPQKSDDDYYAPGNPDQPQYNPQPINTSMVTLDNDLNAIIQKFSEHYHDAWASRKMETFWQYGEVWSDKEKTHPRLKPYSMLNDYVSSDLENFTFPFEFELFYSFFLLFLRDRNVNATKSRFVKVLKRCLL